VPIMRWPRLVGEVHLAHKFLEVRIGAPMKDIGLSDLKLLPLTLNALHQLFEARLAAELR
jgi:hypothetical protein